MRSFHIALIAKTTLAPSFFGMVELGCKKASENVTSMNVTCECFGHSGGSDDATTNLHILESLIHNSTIDAIAVSVPDEETYAPVINQGIQLGKPIITYDADASDSDRLAYVGTDNKAMGRELGKMLAQIHPKGGTYGVVSGWGENLEDRVHGLRRELSDSKWVEVGNTKNVDTAGDHGIASMWELVEENPGLGAVVSVVGSPMFREKEWIDFVNRNEDVLTVMGGALPVQMDLLRKGYADALAGQTPYQMGVRCLETVVEILTAIHLHRKPLSESLSGKDVILNTRLIEVLRIPARLPKINFNYNRIGQAVVLGYILVSLIFLASFASVTWTAINRKNRVVVSSQPVFLIMIAVGTVLMGSAIIPLGIDDSHGQTAADTACMCIPWLSFSGFTIAFSALFSKTWRLNKILLSKNPYKRVQVDTKDVLLPFILLFSLNLVALTCWTVFSPLHYSRNNTEGSDPWNRPTGSYGRCESASDSTGNALPYLLVLVVVNVTALLIANLSAWRARHVRTEYNESQFIGIASISFLQISIVGLPVVFLTSDNPTAFYVVLSCVIFILCTVILICIFVPKVLSLQRSKKKSKNGETDTGSPFDSDEVKEMVQQYNKLSWQDKAKFMQQIGGMPVVRMTQDDDCTTQGDGRSRNAIASAGAQQYGQTKPDLSQETEQADEGSPQGDTTTGNDRREEKR